MEACTIDILKSSLSIEKLSEVKERKNSCWSLNGYTVSSTVNMLATSNNIFLHRYLFIMCQLRFVLQDTHGFLKYVKNKASTWG